MTVQLGSVAPIGFDEFRDPQWLGCMRELGCTSMQIYRNRHGNEADRSGPVTIRQIQEYVAAAELPCDSLHGLYGNDLDPSNPEEKARLAAIDVFKAEGDLALQLGGPLVVVHCAGIFPHGLPHGEKEVRRNQLRKSIEELGRFGQSRSVRYAFENLPPYHAIGYDVADLAELLDEVDLPAVGMCFDVAHANLTGDPIQAVIQGGGQIDYVHICDNHGFSDDHLMPFSGEIDWNAFAEAIRRVGYDGVLMLEVFYKLDELRRLIDEGIGEKLAQFIYLAGGRGAEKK